MKTSIFVILAVLAFVVPAPEFLDIFHKVLLLGILAGILIGVEIRAQILVRKMDDTSVYEIVPGPVQEGFIHLMNEKGRKFKKRLADIEGFRQVVSRVGKVFLFPVRDFSPPNLRIVSHK